MKNMINRNSRSYPRFSAVFVFLFSLFVQLIIIGKHLDNSVISNYAPTASDAADYAARAKVWRDEGFTLAFEDAYRMPGYPSLILVMQYFFPSAPYLAVRVFQMIVLALSGVFLKILLEKFVSTRTALLATSVFALLPLWHFVPALLAEGLTSAVVVALLYVLGSLKDDHISWMNILKISILIALATYLKPNNLMLSFFVFAFLIFTLKDRIVRVLVSIMTIVFLLLAPWILFTNNAQPGFIGLTTTSGVNLYVGTGMAVSYDESLLARSAIKWKVDPKSNQVDIVTFGGDETLSEQNSKLTNKSIGIWRDRPLAQFRFGVDKILIAFGFKSDSVGDYIFGVFNGLALVVGGLLIYLRAFRAWGFAMTTAALFLAIQAFIFQADRRFIAPVLFPIATMCIGLFLGKARCLWFKNLSGGSSSFRMQSDIR